MNNFNKISAEDSLRDLITVQANELENDGGHLERTLDETAFPGSLVWLVRNGKYYKEPLD